MPFHHKLLPALWLTACSAFAALHVAHATAADFPAQPIKLVVVYQAGGANDIVARVLADRMSATIGQPVMVLNKPGASGALGAQFVANSPADGHTVLMGGMPLVVARAMYKTPPVDFEKGLAPVGKAVNLSMVLVARKAFPAQSFAETMALERKTPGSVSMAVTASTYEFYHARINKLAQVDILKVPYSGVPAAMQDLNGNRVDLLIDTLAAQKPFIELGLKGFNDQPYIGMLVPKGTPQPAVQRLNRALNEALARPEVVQRMQALGLTAAPGTPEEFLKEMKTDSDRFVEVGLQAGIEKQQ